MFGKLQIIFSFFLLVSLMATVPYFLPSARAELSSCTATVAEVQLSVNQTASLSFSIANTAATDMKWVRMSSPSENFQIIGGSASGWSRQLTSATVVTFTSGILPAGESQTFTVSIQTGMTETPAAAWTVTASDQVDGSGATTCTGDTAVGIGTDVTAPVITQATAVSITQNQATITWATDEEATSLVDYGSTTAYGSNSNDNNLAASHSRTLTGLTAATTYHYRVSSTDAADNTATGEDKTFTTSAAADVTSPAISGISVTSITTAQAVIGWTTNEAASSAVEYGLTSSYGSTATGSGLTTAHQITVTGLSADKSYHYKIKSTDGSNNLAESADNTFSTASVDTVSLLTSSATPTATPVSSVGAATGAKKTVAPKVTASPTLAPTVSIAPTPAPDLTPPRLQLDTDVSGVWEAAPTVTGQSWDASGVAAIEYSIDGGRNWLPVDAVERPGATKTTFSFTPTILLDGNYEVVVRARDSRGNMGNTPIVTIVFDRLPPRVGASIYFTGSYVLQPDEHGITTTTAGIDQKIVLTAIGGPINIDIVAKRRDGQETPQMFSLVKNSQSGLWFGTVGFTVPGMYDLMVKAVDGAKNETTRTIQPVQVLPATRIFSGETPVEGAKLTVYVKNKFGFFQVWDGQAYGQENPQVSNDEGAAPVFLPPGTYYFTVAHEDFRRYYTSIFTLNRSLPLATTLHLTPKTNWLSSWLPMEEAVEPLPVLDVAKQEDPMANLIGVPLPALILSGSDNAFGLASLRGQTTVVSLLTSWSPLASRQLDELEQLKKSSGTPVVAILVQETPAQAQLLQLRGKYELPILADPLGELIEPLRLQNVPLNIIVDQHGNVAAVLAGLSYKEQLSDKIKQYSSNALQR